MTTIVVRDGVIASDTMKLVFGVDSSAYYDNEPKIRLAENRLFAWGNTGANTDPRSYPQIEAVLTTLIVAYDTGKKPPTDALKAYFGLGLSQVLVMSKIGIYRGYGKELFREITDVSYYAIGTGAVYATESLHTGATAKAAVQFAIDMEALTGGQVVSFTRRQLKGVNNGR